MANRAVTLMRRCKTPTGWRYYPAVIGRTGKVKPNVVQVGDVEVGYPEGYYSLRTFRGSHTVFTRIGTNASDALAAYDKACHLGEARDSAKAAGAVLVEEPGRTALRPAFKKFLTAAEDRGSLEAAEVYELAGEEFLDVIGKAYADEIVPEDIMKYHKALAKRKLAPRTIANRHRNVVAFLLYLKLDTKTLAPKTPRYEKTTPEIYKVEEMTAFFNSLRDDRHQLMFDIFLQTGVREQEAMHLEWSDIDASTRTLKLRAKPRWGFNMKDYEQRDLPVSEELLEELQTYHVAHPDQRPLILGKWSTKRREWVPDGHMLRTLKRLVRVAGLNCGRCDGCLRKSTDTPKKNDKSRDASPTPPLECENWFLHKFRATYCTNLSRAKLDLVTIQKMMGHSDLASTMRYLRPAEGDSVQAAVNAIKWK